MKKMFENMDVLVYWAITCVVAFVVFVSALSSAHAATVSIEKLNDNQKVLYLSGAIEEGDLDRLIEKYNDPSIGYNAYLYLNSPGGNGAEMKKIAEWLSDKGLRSVVKKDHICYSACAVIWAHADQQFVNRGAKIGFHVSSIALIPESIEWLEENKLAYGWSGIMDFVQAQYADDIAYYAGLDVAKPRELALEIALRGDEFFMIDESNANIIGDVFFY